MPWLRNYFQLSTGETYGFWCLIALITLLLGINQLLQSEAQLRYREQTPAFKQKVEQFLAHQRQEESTKTKRVTTRAEEKKPVYFPFNPNSVSVQDLEKLGVESKLAHTIINYRDAGGQFHQKSDLKAIYGMTDSTYQRLKPYVRLPDQERNSAEADTSGTRQAPTASAADTSYAEDSQGQSRGAMPKAAPLAINQADSATLTKLNGIGDFFASEIVERRQRLGGFTSYEQLLAIYNFDSGKLEQVKPQLTLDSNNVDQLSLNKDSFKTFLKHPYLDYPQVKAIFNYTDRVDTVQSVSALRKDQIIGQETFKDISPYLKP
jgi:DNA uptake protein ComE-like DNA-binding protein